MQSPPEFVVTLRRVALRFPTEMPLLVLLDVTSVRSARPSVTSIAFRLSVRVTSLTIMRVLIAPRMAVTPPAIVPGPSMTQRRETSLTTPSTPVAVMVCPFIWSVACSPQ